MTTPPRELLELVDAMGRPDERPAVARALAAALRAEAVFVFVPDPERPAKWLPAPGFATVPSMRGWRELLAQCGEPGVHAGTVGMPEPRPAVAHGFAGVVFVVVGGAASSSEAHAALTRIARVTAALLGAELGLAVVRGELALERQHSETANTLTKALDRARAEAERATRVKDEFLAMLGHELRNPLAPIVTALQMLRMQGMNTRAQDVLERQVAHMLRLVDDLLDISRITTGKIELRLERVELAAAVTRAIEMARPLLEQRRNRLTLSVPETGLAVDADPARLAQIIANLVTNASKYSDPDSAIEVRADAGRSTVSLAVIDHGIGIDPAYLGRVFEQFVQVPQGIDRRAGGLGLGLAIVRNLVERHGGSVRVDSAGRGHGSTFSVELPRSSATRATVASERPALAASRSRARLLLVDDNADAVGLLAEALTRSGHEVTTAHSGPEALELLDTYRPDAGVFDIGLPAMDGYELAQLVKARIPTMKLVALTGYGQATDRARATAAGFDAHLVKPVSVTAVREAVAALLEGRDEPLLR